MTTLTKTYNIVEGVLEFEFHYDDNIAGLADFNVNDMSPLKHGFDSADPREVTVSPSNISISIDDFTGDNYNNFKSLYKAYNDVYPFNYDSVFYILVKLDGGIIFRGIIDELESDNENKLLTVTFADGINKFKDIQISNPYLLDYLYSVNLVPRSELLFGFNQYVYAYGFRRIRYITEPSIGLPVKTPGYFVDQVGNGDKQVGLVTIIRELIRVLRSDLNVEFSNDFRFGTASTPVDEMVFISPVRVKQILRWLIGRYVVIPKAPGRQNQIGEFHDSPEYLKAERFKLIFETEIIKVYWHDFSGEVTEEGSTFLLGSGVSEKTIAEILKVIAKNLFSYVGIKGANTFFFKHKRYAVATPTDITSLTITMRKVLTVDKVSYVKIDDYFTDNYGTDGNNYNQEDQINFKIPLNTIPAGGGNLESRMLYTDLLGNIRDVDYFYDPQTQFRDIPQEVISRAEWEAHKNFRDQYEFELRGINYDFDKTYRINYENYQGLFRPIAIEKDLLNSKTTMTAMEIN